MALLDLIIPRWVRRDLKAIQAELIIARADLVVLRHHQRTIMNDLTNLQNTIGQLEEKATETAATLRGLAQAVIDLKNAANQQEAIDALTTRAQGVLDTLGQAEDEADDQLPTPSGPDPQPTE